MVIISVFQTDDAGSIPVIRSKTLQFNHIPAIVMHTQSKYINSGMEQSGSSSGS